MYLTSLGIVKDVDPERRDDVFVQDIDYTFNPDEVCFSRSGFNHPSSEITFELGVGTTPNTADIVDFVVVSNSEDRYCMDMPGLVHLTQYFGLLKATTDSGQVQQHSDGMYYIDSTTELSTAQIHDGEGCFNARTVHSSNPGNVNDGETVTQDVQFMLGLWYTVELVITNQEAIPQEEAIPGIQVSYDGIVSPASQIYHEEDSKRHVFASVFSRKAMSTLVVQNNLGMSIQMEDLLVKICEFDNEYHRSISTADVWWNFYFEDTIRNHITSYEVALKEESAEGDNVVAGWSSALLDNHYKFLQIDLQPGVHYRSLVRACFASICMPPLISSGFYTAPEAGQPGALTSTASLSYSDTSSEATLDLSIQWDRFAFEHDNAPAMFYAWTLSTTAAVSNDIRDWTGYEGPDDTDTFTVS